MASACFWASRCSLSAMGVSDTMARSRASSAASARKASCSSTTPSSARSCRNRSADSESLRSTNHLDMTRGVYRRPSVDSGSHAATDPSSRLTVGAAEWGVQERWTDAKHKPHDISAATVARLLEAMGTDGEGSPPPGRTLFARRGQRVDVGGPAELATEDGDVRRLDNG